MTNFIKTILDTANDRLKNPFISTFLISWFAFNWRPVSYAFLSSADINERITYIDNNFLNNRDQIWLPLLFAGIYVLIIPYLMLVIDKLSKYAVISRKRNIVEQKLLDLKSKQDIVSEEVVLEQIRANHKEKADLNKTINSLESKIKSQDEMIISLKNNLNEVKTRNKKLEQRRKPIGQEELTEEEKVNFAASYIEFSKSDLFQYFEDIGKEVSAFRTISHIDRFVIEKLIHNNIIVQHRVEEEGFSYDFTKKGHFFWREFVLQKPLIAEKNYKETPLPF